MLIENRGRVVEKAELMSLVWPDTNVEEVGLARNISLLRKALETELEQTPVIETIPRRGYRFVAEVSEVSEAPGTSRKWLLIPVLATLGAALVFYLFYWPSPFVLKARIASLAVVPFECLCPGIDGEAVSRGLNEVMVAELSRVDGIQVISPGTVDRYRRVYFSMSMMGRILGLDALVEGTVQKLDQTLRITVRLVDVRSGKLIWAESYDRDAQPAGAAQASVAQAARAEVSRRLSRPPSN